MRNIMASALTLMLLGTVHSSSNFLTQERGIWSAEQANQWWTESGWFAGCNFIPSTAVNTLEMWQNETYDLVTIDRELGYAESIGFKVARVFIHHLVWQQDPTEFKQRLDNFLSIADKHNIKTMFAMFDDCWNPEGHLGVQPAPLKGVHNSQWVQAPGQAEYNNETLFPLFEQYFLDIIGSFKDDNRIYLWDIYNEPGNSGKAGSTLPLLKKCFEWARAANPSQPISAGLWNWGGDFSELNDYQLSNSDVITFHQYSNADSTKSRIEDLKNHGRPVICTEYMARTIGSKFQTHIPVFHQENVGAINWGLVKGKTNTIFPWNSPEGSEEPKIWFHDVFQPNGSPFDSEETDLIKQHTLGNSKQEIFY